LLTTTDRIGSIRFAAPRWRPSAAAEAPPRRPESRWHGRITMSP